MECKICGNTKDNRTYRPKEMMLGIRDEHEYFECSACGCLQITHIPEDMGQYYPEGYYSYAQKHTNNVLKQYLIQTRDKYAVHGKSIIGRFINLFFPEPKLRTLQRLQLSKDANIMDIGCGAGNLLYSLKEIGFQNLLGIDPFNEKDIHYENGLTIKKQTLAESDGEWDLLMFHHSFEHIAEQHETLAQAWQCLKPNGVCMIRIPTVSSYAWNHYQLDWAQLDAPRHFYLHSVKSLKALADQHNFTVEHVEYDSNAFQFWGSEQYQKDIPLNADNSYATSPEHSLFSANEIKSFEKRSKELNAHNQGDQAVFYLRKKTL
jgi:2-polyprenyl-3-methyl-5-hydroxy-6-metoxy-1,4-benzoquinol methylase